MSEDQQEPLFELAEAINAEINRFSCDSEVIPTDLTVEKALRIVLYVRTGEHP